MNRFAKLVGLCVGLAGTLAPGASARADDGVPEAFLDRHIEAEMLRLARSPDEVVDVDDVGGCHGSSISYSVSRRPRGGLLNHRSLR